jgi:dephospho-CoA kinase
VSTGQSPTRNSPRRIGVTGGIGSGKSTVCKEFERLGRTVIYADPLARELMEKDRDLKRRIVDAFGATAFLHDGAVNRALLAELIFSSSSARARMNAIVHPFVFEAVERIIATGPARRGEPYVLIEAALVYETGMEKMLDAVLLVDAPAEVRAARLAGRDGLTPEQITKRMSSQDSTEKHRKRADFVLDNIGDIREIGPKVAFFDRIFLQI